MPRRKKGLLPPLKPKKGLKTPGTKTRGVFGAKKLPLRPTGPRYLQLGKEPENIGGGPGEPPEGFVGVWTSKTEWYVYWALCKILEPNRDPRKPPFTGGNSFVYQKAEDGGRRIPGGSVTDFAVQTPNQGWIGMRVETERWHIWTTAEQQVKDAFIKHHLASMDMVISLWDQHFIWDESGQATIHVVSLAIKGIELPSPIKWGNAERIR